MSRNKAKRAKIRKIETSFSIGLYHELNLFDLQEIAKIHFQHFFNRKYYKLIEINGCNVSYGKAKVFYTIEKLQNLKSYAK